MVIIIRDLINGVMVCINESYMWEVGCCERSELQPTSHM